MDRKYKIGDIVILKKDCTLGDGFVTSKAGEWGRVYHTEGEYIQLLDIQLGGYSRSKDAFFQAATKVFYWDVEPYNPEA